MITKKEFKQIKKCLNTDVLDITYREGRLFIIEKNLSNEIIAKKVRSRELECVCVIVANARIDKFVKTVTSVIRLIKKGV